MSAPAETVDLKTLVKQRARELREHQVGFSDTVDNLADELYRNERGIETRIGEMGATAGLIGPLLKVAADDPLLVAKTKKGKAKAIQKLRTLISPWVADVYEEE